MSSLGSRVNYLNFFLCATLGIMLWYRNIGPEKPLGAFLIIVSLIFLLESALIDNLDPKTYTTWIFVISWFSIFVLSLIGFMTMYSFSWIPMLIIGLAFLISFYFESWFLLMYLILFPLLVYLGCLTCSPYLILISILGILATFLCLQGPKVIISFWTIMLLLFVIYWFLPYLNYSFHEYILNSSL